MNIKFKSWLLIVGTLVLGLILGTLATSFVHTKMHPYSSHYGTMGKAKSKDGKTGLFGDRHKSGKPNSQKILRHMTRRLDLTESQKKTVEPIIEETFQKMSLIIKASRDSVRMLMEDQREKLEPHLNPEQKVKLEGFYKKMERRHMRHKNKAEKWE